MERTRLLAVVLAGTMILSVLVPFGTVAADNKEHEKLDIDVEQNGDVLVTVSENATTEPVENAIVNVTLAEDETGEYAGVSENKTDEDGIVTLPEPETNVTVSIEAAYDDVTETTKADLEAPEDEDLEGLEIDVEQNDDVLVTVTDNVTDERVENATVNVSVEEGTEYKDVGEETTDENGTVALSVPNESVDVSLTASYDNESVTEDVTLKSTEDQIVEENDTFGNMVSAFVATLEPSESDGGIGSQVSSFVLEHNPGNAPDHAGPPEHAGPDSDSEQGPPEHAGPGGDGEQGPPEHAGPDGDSEQGPPEHAGPDGDSEQGPPEHAGPGSN